MIFVSGPRQVGKTTTCRNHAGAYANWDNVDDREQILAGPDGLIKSLKLDRLSETKPTTLFDELHKYPQWKSFLKGFFDTCADQVHIIVTGSSRMDIYRRGGDSLMGRYFLYHMHPFSLAETIARDLPDPKRIVRSPQRVKAAEFDALWEHGGYPEPFLKRDRRFSRRWQSLRLEQLIREDIRDLTQIQQVAQLELLVRHLAGRSAHQLVYGNLAKEVRVSVDTIRRWIDTLRHFHLGFYIRPWSKNVSRSLRKEPKWFLRDWASIDDAGDKSETFVACHLLKAVDGWNDMGLGKFELGYLRDKEKREVDFVVVRDGTPWFLVEVKYRDESLSRNLRYFQDQVKAPFAFQVIIDAEYVDADCFASPRDPLVVPAKTFLSQLL
ncbi:MAG: AAA family ATPase [Candidatus Eisenbacteria bacterium]|uniref:AAA family ATPase n=1 Tax=Eiseniibacteriota bacterium TaxID=2212470 RepID=A0A948S0K1_UNCEI|nr:AAA family ATPase [Candidatus Eisenbacteria bacterium]MBU1950745.1 AAA family ATPase [Candidatus Eisenbacteria bacterium]MBU2693118.1 AAA family ATPase [Candidatus Eisenbacteria bacterium]